MAITKAKKQDILKGLTDILATAKSVVFVSFKGIDANDTVVMRKKLRSENVGLKVSKKTLIKKFSLTKTILVQCQSLDKKLLLLTGKIY